MKTLLIVEDDRDIQDYYRVLFEDQGVRILAAHTGKEGLEAIDAGAAPDLILLDIVLPEMGGEEFFRALRRERGSSIPVIVCSVDERLAEPLLAVGPVQGLFLKGESGSALVEMVRRQLAL